VEDIKRCAGREKDLILREANAVQGGDIGARLKERGVEDGDAERRVVPEKIGPRWVVGRRRLAREVLDGVVGRSEG
jgi:hypothetical protein